MYSLTLEITLDDVVTLGLPLHHPGHCVHHISYQENIDRVFQDLLTNLFQKCISNVSHCIAADVVESTVLAFQTVVDGIEFVTGTFSWIFSYFL